MVEKLKLLCGLRGLRFMYDFGIDRPERTMRNTITSNTRLQDKKLSLRAVGSCRFLLGARSNERRDLLADSVAGFVALISYTPRCINPA